MAFFSGSKQRGSQDDTSSRYREAPHVPLLRPAQWISWDMDCSSPQDFGGRDSQKRAATSLFTSPSYSAPVRKKSLQFHNSADYNIGDLWGGCRVPALDNAVSEHTLKQIMTLQRGIQKDFYRSILHIQSQVDDLGDRTDRVKQQLTDCTDAYNELVDAQHEQAPSHANKTRGS